MDFVSFGVSACGSERSICEAKEAEAGAPKELKEIQWVGVG